MNPRTICRRLAVVLLLTGLALPALATPTATMEVSEERLILRYDGFEFPRQLRTSEGKRLPRGEYDLAVIESEDGVFLQLIRRANGKGRRVAAVAIGRVLVDGSAPSGPVRVSLRAGDGEHSLVMSGDGIAVAFDLSDIRQ